jgi:hypothetical protein
MIRFRFIQAQIRVRRALCGMNRTCPGGLAAKF